MTDFLNEQEHKGYLNRVIERLPVDIEFNNYRDMYKLLWCIPKVRIEDYFKDIMINDEEQKPFPFEEIRDEHGDYFSTVDQAEAAGFSERQIWSVTIDDELDEDTGQERTTLCFGPHHHYVNLLGYVATIEPRMSDDEYYYETATVED